MNKPAKKIIVVLLCIVGIVPLIFGGIYLSSFIRSGRQDGGGLALMIGLPVFLAGLGVYALAYIVNKEIT